MLTKITRQPTHPGDIIKFDYLEPLALKVTALAERLGVSRKTLSTIINRRAGVTPDMALRLSLAFKTSPELWLNLQRAYDLWAARQTDSGWKQVRPVEMGAARR